MFTGIIQETGRVLSFGKGKNAWEMKVSARKCQEDLALGDSIAVNGCCLTAVDFDDSSVTFELLEETVRVTAFHELFARREDDPIEASRDRENAVLVNLESSLRFNGKMGGHFVSGHIDVTGRITHLEKRGKDYYLRVEPPAEDLRSVIYKGSIAIDGVSLTVAEVDDTGFAVWLIPHTLKETNLKDHRVGDSVNLEFDLLGKYVERLLHFK